MGKKKIQAYYSYMRIDPPYKEGIEEYFNDILVLFSVTGCKF